MRRHRHLSILLSLIFSVTGAIGFAQNHSVSARSDFQSAKSNGLVDKAVMEQNYGKLPLSFEINQGQTDPQARFLSRGNGYSLFLTKTGTAVLAMTKLDVSQPKLATLNKRPPVGKTEVIRMELTGAQPAPAVAGQDRLPGTANYFVGHDPSKWHSSIPTYGAIRYTNVYPGVDLRYYGNQRQLEYDFVVAPKADPKPIRLHFAGARRLSLTKDGDLRVAANDGEIAFHKPVVYQTVNGDRLPVLGKFSLLGKSTATFSLGKYDSSKELVIDPTLEYSTLLIGSAISGDEARIYGMNIDSNGDVFVTGWTTNADFPISTGAFETSNNSIARLGQATAFVTKLNPSGTALIYSTFLGGNTLGDSEYGDDIAVDSSGNAYVTGVTMSLDFPVTAGAFQATRPNSGDYTGFVTKLNPDGTSLVYSTYLGGRTWIILHLSRWIRRVGICGGVCRIIQFPGDSRGISNHIQVDRGIRGEHVCLEAERPGKRLIYSTFIGGTKDSFVAQLRIQERAAVAIDAAGNTYLEGVTDSTDFPVTQGAYQTTNPTYQSITISKLNPSGTALVFSTYLTGKNEVGGSYNQSGGIAVDSTGNVYITGITPDTDFPVTAGAFETTSKIAAPDAGTAFVAKVDPAGTAWFTRLF